MGGGGGRVGRDGEGLLGVLFEVGRAGGWVREGRRMAGVVRCLGRSGIDGSRRSRSEPVARVGRGQEGGMWVGRGRTERGTGETCKE